MPLDPTVLPVKVQLVTVKPPVLYTTAVALVPELEMKVQPVKTNESVELIARPLTETVA